MPHYKNASESFIELLKIMDRLRLECPWDKAQTMGSLSHLTIEEVYELTQAISDADAAEIKNELGDLLLHIVFYAKIGEEENAFDINSVCKAISEKLIKRHPHIYGDTQAHTPETVAQNWEKIKLGEGKKSVLSGVPKGLPALVKAQRIQDKVAGVGFDWEEKEDVWQKVVEEMGELHDELLSGNTQAMEEEFGDVLFSLINYARFIGVNPENALQRTNTKFINRFQKMENKISDEGKQITEMNLDEMDRYWDSCK